MATYLVQLSERSHRVMGLPRSRGEGIPAYPDTLLVYHYPGGDIDTRMLDAHMMLGALYDLFQCVDELKDGDVFQTEFGEYRCSGVHVIPCFDMGPKPNRR